jgi:predicted ester cyclase
VIGFSREFTDLTTNRLFWQLLTILQRAAYGEKTVDTAKIEANKDLVRLWILEGWNRNRNEEVIEQVFAKDWIDGNPAFPNQPQGIEGAMYFVNVYRSIFPDIQFSLTHIVADEEYVMFRFTANATHKGELMGIAPTNKKVTISGIVLHRVENGRFAESWNEIDLWGVRQQLMDD